MSAALCLTSPISSPPNVDSGIIAIESRTAMLLMLPTAIISLVTNIALMILSAIPAIFSESCRDYFKRRAYSIPIDGLMIAQSFVGIFSPQTAFRCFGMTIAKMSTEFPAVS